MKFGGYNIGGQIVKQDERYTVRDNTSLRDLIVSSTELNRGCSTNGHSHSGQEEVYQFVWGTGKMQLGEETFDVGPGDVVLVPDGAFHRVFNTGAVTLYFVCVFNGKRVY